MLRVASRLDYARHAACHPTEGTPMRDSPWQLDYRDDMDYAEFLCGPFFLRYFYIRNWPCLVVHVESSVCSTTPHLGRCGCCECQARVRLRSPSEIRKPQVVRSKIVPPLHEDNQYSTTSTGDKSISCKRQVSVPYHLNSGETPSCPAGKESHNPTSRDKGLTLL